MAHRRFSIVRSAFTLGLAVGLVELALVLARSQFFDHGLQRKSRHVVWMLPLCDVLLFLAAGGLLSCAAARIPRLSRTATYQCLATLAIFSLLLAVPLLNAFSSLILAAGIASWLSPAWDAPCNVLRPGLRWVSPALLMGFAGCVAWTCVSETTLWHGHTDAPIAAPGAPNVLLVVMDTVRADAVASASTAPHLAALAQQGVRAQRAIATAPWTLPSHASMFTGRWTWELGVGPDRGLDDRFPTLAEHLCNHGYATAGFVGNTGFCASEYGLARGFEHYDDFDFSPAKLLRCSALGLLVSKALRQSLDFICEVTGCLPRHPFELDYGRKPAAEINAQVLRWLDRPRSRPFFIFVNYFDTHDPYLLPPGVPDPTGGAPRTWAEVRLIRDWISSEQRSRSPAELKRAKEAYTSCVAYVDAQLGVLLGALRQRGLLDNTLVIVTADHGEHLGEHSDANGPLCGHRTSLFQQEVHVPLVLAGVGLPCGATVTQPLSLRDLAATIADLSGTKSNSPFPGDTLMSRLAPGRIADDLVISELNSSMAEPVVYRYQGTRPGVSRALYEGPFAYHRDDQGREMLFHLDSDPDELQDLAQTEAGRAIADHLGARLDEGAPTH